MILDGWRVKGVLGWRLDKWTMARLFWICMAGALGTGARYLIGIWAEQRLGKNLPFGTLIVNIAGCFLIGLVMHLALRTTAISPTLRLVLTTGFMGGLTTYSSFNYDTTRLLQAGSYGAAMFYFFITVALCFAAGFLGMGAARLVVGGR
jgi:CrcB protein